MKTLEKIIDRIFALTDIASRIFLCMIFVLMWIVVFGRYFFSYTPMWSEDLILFSMCWLVMLSGAEAFRRNAHLNISIFQNSLPSKMKTKLMVATDFITIVFFTWMVWYGIEDVMQNVTVMYTGLKISKMWVFISFPISFVLCVLAKADKYIVAYNKSKEKEA